MSQSENLMWMVYNRDVPVAHLEIDFLEDDSRQAQVSVIVSLQHRRKGYGLKVLQALLEHEYLAHIRRFVAFIHKDNLASQHLFKKAGFTLISDTVSEQRYLDYEWLRT